MKEKPILKLYKYENSTFSMVAQIDDYQQISFEHNLYKAGTFTITINYNIPNAKLFKKGLFIQFGNNKFDFGEITKITNSIGSDGKGSELINIVGYDARYLFKRRIIKNLNSNDKWTMTDKTEMCIRSLVYSEAGAGAETARRLPISNTIPTSANAIGKEYSVSESYTNLYDVLCTIATQGEIGWAVTFENNELSLEVYAGENKSTSVFFSTDYESLSKGEFTDSNESFANSVYIGGKGTGSERDLFEGAIDDGSGNEPSSLDRFEAFDNKSSMTTEAEYETEANSMLTQYGQTVTVRGAGMVKCPFVFREEYDIGDIIRMKFSDKTADVQILSVTEQWSWNTYSLSFSFGKPQNTLGDQLNLILKKIEIASNKTNAIESVKWYTIPTDTEQTKADVTFNTLGFTGTMTDNVTFTLYADDEGTGSKDYNIYVKNLSGNFSLTLTTGKEGATDYVLQSGTYNAQIYIDEEGNIIQKSITPINAVTEGSKQTVTSGAVAELLANPEGDYKEGLLNFCYPVGSLYWTSNVTFDPNVSFGGTWTRIKDTFIYAMGDNDTINDTGGAKTVTLDYKNLPDHHHAFEGSSATTSEMSGSTSGSVECGSEGLFNGRGNITTSGRISVSGSRTYAGGDNADTGRPSKMTISLSHTHTVTAKGKATGVRDTSDNTFTQTAVDKMPPYICKICWERTA